MRSKGYDKAVSLYLTETEYRKFKKLAEKNLRSMSNMAKMLVLREIEAQGIELDEEGDDSRAVGGGE